MVLRLFTILLYFVGISVCSAQQRAQFSQYMVNNYVLNPAVGGTEDFTDFKAGFRTQWLGFEGAPTTYYFSVHTAIGREYGPSHNHHRGEKKNWHALGMYTYNDITGPTRRTSALVSYGYNIGLSRKVRMSFGMYGGFQQYKIDGNEFVLTDEIDNVLNGVHTTFVPDAVVGTWIYSKDFYFGISANQILQSKLDFNGIGSINSGTIDLSKLNNHYFITGGFLWPINYSFSLVPTFMIKYVTPAPVSVDINCKLDYEKGRYWGGFSYRSLDSFTLIGGMQFTKHFSGSYSFDLTTSELRKYNTGTHEIVVSYRVFPKPTGYCPSKFWH